MINDFTFSGWTEFVKLYDRVSLVKVCEPRSLVVLLDATISNIREIAE